MTEECIHGFQAGLCASCFPKPVPEAPAKARSATRTRVAAAPRPSVRSLRTAARHVPTSAPSMSVLDQRIYYVTHVRNLPEIFSRGALLADESQTVELGTPELRAGRSETPAPGAEGRTLDAFVPFFLSPDARLWQALRDKQAHFGLAPDAANLEAADFVFLITTMRQAISEGNDFVIADGNAEGTFTRFAVTRDDAEHLLRRLRADATGEAILDAEFLVSGEVPLGLVTLIGVANDKVRLAVREIVASSGYAPRISVYPPWFQPAG
jgi:hypothetical protein